MFGKKEEKWKYIGENYHLGDNGEIIPHPAGAKFVNDLKLIEGEQILCVKESGKQDTRYPDNREKHEKRKILFLKSEKAINIMFIIGFILLAFSGIHITFLGLLFTLPSLLFGPVVFVIGVIMIIVGGIKVCRKGLNHCLTDRRIISFGANYWQEIPLEDVVSTRVVAGKNNKGKLIIRAIIDSNMKKRADYIFPDVEDPLAVKYRLDQAVEKCKSDQF